MSAAAGSVAELKQQTMPLVARAAQSAAVDTEMDKIIAAIIANPAPLLEAIGMTAAQRGISQSSGRAMVRYQNDALSLEVIRRAIQTAGANSREKVTVFVADDEQAATLNRAFRGKILVLGIADAAGFLRTQMSVLNLAAEQVLQVAWDAEVSPQDLMAAVALSREAMVLLNWGDQPVIPDVTVRRLSYILDRAVEAYRAEVRTKQSA